MSKATAAISPGNDFPLGSMFDLAQCAQEFLRDEQTSNSTRYGLVKRGACSKTPFDASADFFTTSYL